MAECLEVGTVHLTGASEGRTKLQRTEMTTRMLPHAAGQGLMFSDAMWGGWGQGWLMSCARSGMGEGSTGPSREESWLSPSAREFQKRLTQEPHVCLCP